MVCVCAAEDEIIRVNFEGGTTEKSYVPSSSRGRVIHLFSGQTHSETNALDNLHSTVLSFGFVERTFFLGGPSPSLFGSFRLGASYLSEGSKSEPEKKKRYHNGGCSNVDRQLLRMKGLLGALTILKHSDYVLQVTHSSNCVYEKKMFLYLHKSKSYVSTPVY